MAFAWISSRTRGLRTLGVSLVSVFGVLAASSTTIRAQNGRATDAGWAMAVDRYLASDLAGTISILSAMSPDEIRAQADAAVQSWLIQAKRAFPASTEQRTAVRRIQAATLIPLEVLLTLPRASNNDARAKAYEKALVLNWPPLMELARSPGIPSKALEHFHHWSRIGYFQALLNAGSLYALESVARSVQPPDDAPAKMRAEFFFLRGMGYERQGRYSDTSVSGGQTFDFTDLAAGAGARAITVGRADIVRRSLTVAARWYERAAELAPGHAEVRVHLGRTLLERQQIDAAIRALAPLTDASCMSTWCALAQLFTAEAHDLAGRSVEASNAFARAAGHPATRQSALVALMQLSLRTADPAAGVDLTSQLLATSPLWHYDQPDAWSEYLMGSRRNVDAVLGPMREALLR